MYLKNKTLSTVSSTMFAVFLMEKSAIDTKSSGKKRERKTKAAAAPSHDAPSAGAPRTIEAVYGVEDARSALLIQSRGIATALRVSHCPLANRESARAWIIQLVYRENCMPRKMHRTYRIAATRVVLINVSISVYSFVWKLERKGEL